MSKAIFELEATTRTDMGKGASRRLRRLNNEVPAIMYGGNEKPLSIKLDHNKVLQAIEHEAFFSHILTLNVDGKKQKAVLKDIQRHPYKRSILHIDFQRVTDNYVITMQVPLHFLNEEDSKGAKSGGMISHHLSDVSVRCKAKDLPEYIEVDLIDLELDQALHLSDLTLPKGVSLPDLAIDESHNLSVVSIHAPKKAAEPTEEAPAAEAEKPAEGEGDKEKADKPAGE